MTRLRRVPLADQAADALFMRIRAGEWALGAKLPGETTLAPQLGVGRSTVREAIRQLAGRGVLDSRHGSGVYVTALEVPEEWEQVLRRADIVTVIEARTAIEVEAASLPPRAALRPICAWSDGRWNCVRSPGRASKSMWMPIWRCTARS